jgi:hypothetical protein
MKLPFATVRQLEVISTYDLRSDLLDLSHSNLILSVSRTDGRGIAAYVFSGALSTASTKVHHAPLHELDAVRIVI